MQSIYEAFSVAIATTFVIGVIATIGALVAAVFLKEIPLRTQTASEAAARPAPRLEKVPAAK